MYPEFEGKKYFAEIIGEPFVPEDWGGEKSDLYTTRDLPPLVVPGFG